MTTTTLTVQERMTNATDSYTSGLAARAWLAPAYVERGKWADAGALAVIAPVLGIPHDAVQAVLDELGRPPRPLDQRERWIALASAALLQEAGYTPSWSSV